MARVEEAVRSAIERAVARECRTRRQPLVREIRNLKRELMRLEQVVKMLKLRCGQRPPEATGAVPELPQVRDEEARQARLTPAVIKKLRARLGVTQAQLAVLMGVTGPAIAQWEGGKNEPQGRNRIVLVALRKMGRGDVSRMFAARGLSYGRSRRPTAKR